MGRKKKDIDQGKVKPSDRKEFLKNLMRETNKKLGIDCVQFGNSLEDRQKLSTGIKQIDSFLGGGIPYGTFTTIWGNAGSGKTTICYNIITEAQKLGKIVYYLPLEGKIDKERIQNFGVNLNDLIIGEFPIAEQSLDTIIKYSKEKVVDVIILDSIHSLSPKGEQEEKSGKEKSLEDDTMALLARKLSQFFRMATHYISTNNIAVVLIGQTRMNVGFITLEQLTGGNALKHYSKLILNMRKGQKADAPTINKKIVGFDCVIKIDKTQISGTQSEYSEIHLPYYFDTGFYKE